MIEPWEPEYWVTTWDKEEWNHTLTATTEPGDVGWPCPVGLGTIVLFTNEKEKDMAAGAEDFYEEKLDRAERRREILATINDMVMDFLYYGRTQDDEISTDDLFEAITSGDISVEELAGYFGAKLREEVFGS